MFCFLDAESCVLLPESLLNVVDNPGGRGAATLRPYFRMRAGGVGSGAGAPAPAARSAESCWGAACRARTALSGSGALLQSCAAGEAGLSAAGRGIVRPSSALPQRGIAAILRRRRSGSLLVGARHRCNPAPQRPRGAPAPAARSAESCWGAASCARSLLSGSGASLQSCAAGEAGLSAAGRGMPRPYSAQRQRGIATILHRRRSGSPLGGARHAAPVQRSAAAGHCYNPAPQAKRVSPRRGAACRSRPLLCRSGASLQSCTAGEAGLSAAGRGMPRPYSAQRQRGIAAILHRRRSGSPLGGARHRAPVQCSAAAGHCCNPAPQAKRVSPRRGAASCARPLLCRSGALLQSCTAGEAGLSAAGRGIVRPFSAQRQRGIAAILRRSDHEALPPQPRAARSRAPMCYVVLNGTPVRAHGRGLAD
jgi:hypothetical protein